jgi:hypothetical protein
MRVRQYAHFSIKSDDLALPDITARLGTEPDEVRQKGSRRGGSVSVPRCNIWQLNSGLPRTVHLNDHFEALAAKLLPLTDPISTLLTSPDAHGYLVVCRVFTTGPGDDDVLAHTGTTVDIDDYSDEYDRPC